MTIRDIQYITVIAEENNITRAAQRLFISQPSLSQVLKKVEAELDAVLFTRTTDGLQPTYIGEEFLTRAGEILGSFRRLEHFISDVNNLQDGRLNIGVPYYLNGSFLSEILPRFSSLYPGIDVNVIQNTDLELDTLLGQGNLDLVIAIPEAVSNKFQKTTILKCRLVLSPPSNVSLEEQAVFHEGDKFPTVPLSVLDGKIFLEYDSASPLYQLSQAIIARSGATVTRKPLSGYGVDMVRRCSKAGLGYAVIPECMLIPDRVNPSDRYYYLEGDEGIFYSICTAWPAEGTLPLAAQKLISMAQEFFK